jgi:hypothetical protein
MTMRIAVIAATFALSALPAAAQVDLSSGPEYEQGFRVACGARFDARDCQCGLENLQARIGYEAFAAAAARSGDEFFRRTELPTAALVEACGRDRRVAEARADATIHLVADRPVQTVSASVVIDEICRAREAQIVPGIKALIDRPDPRGTAELQAVIGNLSRARESCAAGDAARGLATYDHVAVFLAAGGFGDAAVLP